MPSAVSNRDPSESTEIPTNKKKLVLIVDDEADICYLLKEILHNKKIEADCVTSIAQADEFLQNHDPALIFLDNKLNDGLGVDHVRDFKIKHPGANIIMMSAYDNAADREKAFMEGADYFISKPFSRKIILDTINSLEREV